MISRLGVPREEGDCDVIEIINVMADVGVREKED